ncbi:hypothetical protein BH20CHL5_BH20CHL5_02980 [soil metagenome]
MDAIELLTDDHAALKKLLEQGDQTTERGVKTRTELLQRIKTELTAHEVIEEEIFYPALKEHPKATPGQGVSSISRTGRLKPNSDPPPSRGAAHMRPPMAVTRARHTKRPMPAPLAVAAVVAPR